MKPFPCTSCGACCRRIETAVKAVGNPPSGDLLHFPYTWDETGKCENLGKENRCNIYETRPFICRVDDFADMLQNIIPRDKFILENIKACNTMMDQDGLPLEFRIKTEHLLTKKPDHC